MFSKTNIFFATIIILVAPICFAKPVLNMQRWQTSNGADVYFVAANQLPMVDIAIAFSAGSARDGDLQGIATLSNDMLNQGAGHYTADQIAEQFDNVGAIYTTEVSRDYAIISLRSLTEPEKLQAALSTFTTVLTDPRFPADAFQRSRNNQIASLQQQQQSPEAVADNAFYKAIYHDAPYGHPVLGSINSVKTLTETQAKQFYQRYYVAKNASIALVGAIDLAQAKAMAEQISKGLPSGVSAAPIPDNTIGNAAVIENIHFPSNQTIIRIGQIGISRHAKDYFPLIVGNYTLGGGMLVSRLSNEVREKRGLSYDVHSLFVPMAAKGPFFIALGTKTDQAQLALQIAKQTLENYLAQGSSESELQAAKKNISGGFVLRFDSNEKIAQALLGLGIFHLPDNFYDTYIAKVNAVTVQQIKQAFAQHLVMNKMVTVSVGK